MPAPLLPMHVVRRRRLARQNSTALGPMLCLCLTAGSERPRRAVLTSKIKSSACAGMRPLRPPLQQSRKLGG
eukprot:7531628-Prorocentrum_lima.AAC.1